ncbi:MAG: hypothetical protein IV101_08930 [Dechloromonas sp.]|uniref:hypothetical protein n=1 Tax=Dechloromonas sp. TaxID=1917218 RepID=UPI0027EBF48D|nr:hypothetical protein [Dechloromonas sp.]MBT9521007.1 hypothetical protein [Dechloromonas sp.]
MNSVNFPYAPISSQYLALLALIMGLSGCFLVVLNDSPAILVGGAFIALSLFLGWKVLSTPRSANVDFETGIVNFRPPFWFSSTSRKPFRIHDYSVIQAAIRGRGLSYYVILSDAMGASITLLSSVEASVAEQACDILATHFKLRNLGLM